ncbi:MAG: copper resistance protein CopZ [Xanthobacteraceae bacterium]|nr:MAG: copper resistance protein CopZ [Xanthobacteraceae bacterium]
MRRALLIAVALVLAACDQKPAATTPSPHDLTADAIGHYCGMNVLEHPGPKGQIILASRVDPVWFSSARDTIAFTMLPEEAKDIQAIYVSDMARAESWDKPGAANWVEARKAWFVLDSRMRGGMGAEEAVPFSSRDAAARFVGDNGGRIAAFGDIPRDYVLGGTAPEAPSHEQHAPDK